MRAQRLAFVVAIVAVAAAASAYWYSRRGNDLPDGFAKGNGRIEAERIDVAGKFAGRIAEILVAEGDRVAAGQVLARFDSSELQAQVREAEAAVQQAREQLRQATAEVARRLSERAYAEKELERALQLMERGHVSAQRVDQRQNERATAVAAYDSARAQVAAATAAIEAAAARVERLKTDLDEQTLKAPRGGRVQYRLAQPGEVLPAGGKVLTLLDLSDVYMTIFLPTRDAGRLAYGSDARLVLDAAQQYVIPARVTFVAAEAQFTPKYVETETEREKLMFRVKVQIPRELLDRFANVVKTGLTGVAYVKVAAEAQWPERLAVHLP